ncbi:MAG TPA: SdrD B-like domain-containing protein [Gemmatimonadaceae bacterium]|jgi:hypothetical protein
MRGSRVVLALAMSLFAARVTNAQTSSGDDKQCIVKARGNPSDTGLANRADPTQQGSKNCPPPSVGHATISGALYFDLDENGMMSSDEEGLVGWTVQLTGPVSQSVLSVDGGLYSFSGLSSGTYTVCVMTLPMWTQTGPVSGEMCPLGKGYKIVVPSLASDMSYNGNDFGFVTQP